MTYQILHFKCEFLYYMWICLFNFKNNKPKPCRLGKKKQKTKNNNSAGCLWPIEFQFSLPGLSREIPILAAPAETQKMTSHPSSWAGKDGEAHAHPPSSISPPPLGAKCSHAAPLFSTSCHGTQLTSLSLYGAPKPPLLSALLLASWDSQGHPLVPVHDKVTWLTPHWAEVRIYAD